MLQEGPQCGLVALAMATTCGGGEGEEVGRILSMAREGGHTRRGEVFSVASMASLARLLLPTRKVEVAPVSRLLDTSWLLEHLLGGGLLLVPYDCSPNHSPGLYKGHKAHWALVTGCLVPTSSPPPSSSPLASCPGFHLLPPGKEAVDLLPLLLAQEDLLLVARQSKSVLLQLWGREDLVESCSQLVEVAEARLDGSYVIPEGGVLEGLCGQCVTLT